MDWAEVPHMPTAFCPGGGAVSSASAVRGADNRSTQATSSRTTAENGRRSIKGQAGARDIIRETRRSIVADV
jgi:hypothetical protein